MLHLKGIQAIAPDKRFQTLFWEAMRIGRGVFLFFFLTGGKHDQMNNT